MTCIAAISLYGETVMAADSCVTANDGNQVVPHGQQKIVQIDETLVGFAGWSVYRNILEDVASRDDVPPVKDKQTIFKFLFWLRKKLLEDYGFVREQSSDADYPFTDLSSTFLFANREGVYMASHGLSVVDCGPWYAIGSGQEYALGALHALVPQALVVRSLDTQPERVPMKVCAETAVRGALMAACDLEAYCRGPVTVERLAEK